jgi:uncharacterized protein involved in tolerance to divalent cations
VTDAVIVLTTLPASDQCPDLARILVEERLAACVSTMPEMASTYRWEGNVESAREHQLLIKTTVGRLAALARRVRDVHPYELPEVLVLPVAAGGEGYLTWLRQSTVP